MTRDELIETMARAMAESANGGKFWEDQWYAEDHRKLWITRATAALTAIEAAGVRVVPVEALSTARADGMREAARIVDADIAEGRRVWGDKTTLADEAYLNGKEVARDLILAALETRDE